MENKAKPSFVGLIPFLIFVAIYLGTGVVLQMKGVGMAFYQLPAPVAVFVGIIAAFILFKRNYHGKNSILSLKVVGIRI